MNRFLSSILILAVSMTAGIANGQKTESEVAAEKSEAVASGNLAKSKLRILYVGPDPNVDAPARVYDSAPSAKRRSELTKERASAFKKLLDAHFESVRILKVADYKPSMSDDVDVTIMDAMPPPIESVDMGNWTKHYRMPFDFDRPMVMVGTVAPSALGRNGMGLRMDHL